MSPPNVPKMAAGESLAAITGKANVSMAANSQCVKLPRACPFARSSCGNISAMNTQITVPCPSAWDTMKRKMQPAATPEAAQIMCDCIWTYHAKTGRMVGFKPAGGISTPEDALTYWNIVSNTLGEAWLDKRYFRFGASRMANNLLSALEDRPVKYY